MDEEKERFFGAVALALGPPPAPHQHAADAEKFVRDLYQLAEKLGASRFPATLYTQYLVWYQQQERSRG